ncbi:MAG: MATE family efflux transporter [Succinivibrio sp.]
MRTSFRRELHSQLRLFFPFLTGQFCACGMGVVDTVMAGLAGTIDISGVAVACSFYWPAYMFLSGVAYGLTPTTSLLLGLNNFPKMQLARYNALICCTILGILTAILLALVPCIFSYIPSDKNMMDVAAKYLYFVSFALPSTAIFNAYRCYSEGLGITRPTMYFGIIMLLLDIPLNYIFIFGKLGMPAMGGVGCGMTSAFINILTAVMIYFYVTRGKIYKKYEKNKKLYFDIHSVRSFMHLSLPLGFSRTAEVACFSLAAVILSPFGPTTVAAHSITLNVSGMIFMIPLCLSMTATIRVSLMMGTKNFAKAYIAAKTTLFINLVTFALYFLMLITLREKIASLYTDDLQVLALTTGLMLFNCFYLFPDCIQCMFMGVLQGFKDSKTILINTIFSYWIVGFPLSVILAYGIFTEKMGAYGVWTGFLICLVTSAIIYVSRAIYLFRKQKMPKLLRDSYEVS